MLHISINMSIIQPFDYGGFNEPTNMADVVNTPKARGQWPQLFEILPDSQTPRRLRPFCFFQYGRQSGIFKCY
jgi:hypothetical protein